MEDVIKNIKNGSKVEAIGFSYFGDNLILMDKDLINHYQTVF